MVTNKENKRFEDIVDMNPELAELRGRNNGEYQDASLLHVACGDNNIFCINVLMKNSCSSKPVDAKGRTPIHWAAVYGSIEAAKRLLASDDEGLINSFNTKYKGAPLHYAARNGEERFVRFLLKQPCINVNLKDSRNKMADEYDNIKHPSYLKIQQLIREHRDKLSKNFERI